jgi:hypothetical protein
MQNKFDSASMRDLTGWIGYRRRVYEAETCMLDEARTISSLGPKLNGERRQFRVHAIFKQRRLGRIITGSGSKYRLAKKAAGAIFHHSRKIQVERKRLVV